MKDTMETNKTTSREERFDVNNWLRNTYGLDDDDCLSAGRVEELAEQLEYDVRVRLLDELLSEVDGKEPAPQLEKYLDLVKNGNKDDMYDYGVKLERDFVRAIINHKKQA